MQRIGHRTSKTRKWSNKNFLQKQLPKLNITIEDLLGESDFQSQDAIIVRKKVKEFNLETGKEIQN